MIELILFTFAIICLAIASYTDIKTREIPDYLSYIFISGALGISLIYSLYSSFYFFLYALLGSAIAFAVGYLLYRTKQLGGGDVKLFIGIGGIFFNVYLFGFPLLLTFAAIILFVGGLYTLIWGLNLFFKNYSEAKKEFKILLKNYYIWRIILLGLAFIFLVSSIFVPNPSMKLLIAILAILFIGSFYLILFIKVIESLHFIKSIPVSKLTEGDWLAKDVKLNNKIILSSKIHSLEKEHLSLLKKHNIKNVVIKLGVPFVPAILISFIISIILYGILG